MTDTVDVTGFPDPLPLVHPPVFHPEWATWVASVALPDGGEAAVFSLTSDGPWHLVVPFVRNYA